MNSESCKSFWNWKSGCVWDEKKFIVECQWVWQVNNWVFETREKEEKWEEIHDERTDSETEAVWW